MLEHPHDAVFFVRGGDVVGGGLQLGVPVGHGVGGAGNSQEFGVVEVVAERQGLG